MRENLAAWFRWLPGLAPHVPRPNVEDRRLWVRYPCEIETTFSQLRVDHPARVEARIQNVSVGGISLLTQEPFEPGTLLTIELPASGEASASQVLAYLVRCTPQAGGLWENGCVFSLELDDEELAQFGAASRLASPSDQRGWVRFAGEARATYQRVRHSEQMPRNARLIDISANGLGLEVYEPIEVGSLLNIDLTARSGGGNLPILASVVRIGTAADQQWRLGCNFLRELTDLELQPFRKIAP